MKQHLPILIIILTFLIYPNVSFTQTKSKSILNGNSKIWIKTSTIIKTLDFEDSCFQTELELIEGNSTDSIIYLTNKCTQDRLSILAAKYKYPEGNKIIRTAIYQDTIKTFSIKSFLGQYEESYYEVLTDSIISISVINQNGLIELSTDSVRHTAKVKK